MHSSCVFHGVSGKQYLFSCSGSNGHPIKVTCNMTHHAIKMGRNGSKRWDENAQNILAKAMYAQKLNQLAGPATKQGAATSLVSFTLIVDASAAIRGGKGGKISPKINAMPPVPSFWD